MSDEVDGDDTEVKNRARSGLTEKGVKRRATSHFTELCCRCRKAVMIQTDGIPVLMPLPTRRGALAD